MGAWGPGPFDNDEAAEFAVALDRAPAQDRAALVRHALTRVIHTPDRIREDTSVVAVAAAALVAAQRPDAPPVSALHAPAQPIPRLPDDLTDLAVRALDAVLAAHADTAAQYGETELGAQWREQTAALYSVLLD
ncbi:MULTISPECIES: DUF4259 domain-containing protein [Streptomycetaceae]|uniref:DUF4259 domain-containing protein n=1 Tax=Streptantibioticus cattleyicolor (strain ATCC 35852 / DSM 46488 / JCM 4925 / NBRC 14057 / NRRL 8057) TaxID=1003195 RepID=F8JRZ1_STREN|nr:DUF4259 domain-containing protein [Streptantibioticus cattleyicolor]AEW92901.1 hypothetical protein SCATT_05300 [Streptantibioticus cattleyicolor NRRL 8057 = DSM 46488]MYS57652.1 DUF4259 domain-containing protein [Streptomyces sp. SID5468]CCB73258.1 Predicted protein [Streptantibioticus cattleyicolor NRRL 8057 = DSM 46488]